MKHKINNVARVAFRDITEYINNEFSQIMTRHKHGWDLWVATPNYLDNKETRLLNKELGISDINFIGNKNYRYCKKNKKRPN